MSGGGEGMSKHTPGPWIYGEDSNGEWYFTSSDNPYCRIGLVCNNGDVKTREMTRRIVACVNACEGISTEALEHRGHLLQAEDSIIKRLSAEHAELLAAAKLTIDLYDSENDPSRTTFSEIVEMYCASDNALRAAIAKAGGKE
jgi:hypothetical protein